MALSQIQCLDDNHVNPRTHESKPEFFYCEDQRLAIEALLRDGRDAFVKYLETRGLRAFLSDLELETLAGEVEPFDPGSELFLDNVKDDPAPLSLHYWPELSDTSTPQMDLGWPNNDSYRGVTRTSVYTQPPLDGQAHIKEVVRKMITQAQKVGEPHVFTCLRLRRLFRWSTLILAKSLLCFYLSVFTDYIKCRENCTLFSTPALSRNVLIYYQHLCFCIMRLKQTISVNPRSSHLSLFSVA